MQITSSAFKHNGKIPSKYTCDGEDVNPDLSISGILENTKTLALIMHDPDAPVEGGWTHWVVFNIPVTDNIAENSVPGKEGFNSFKQTAWGGPCPPSGTHRYFFYVYALDTELTLDSSPTKADVEKAMENHILEKAELMGLYIRSS